MASLHSDLRALLGAERLLTEPEHLLTYGFDGTAALHGAAWCVALPETVEEVAAVVRYANEHRVPLVTRGSGTGLSGGSVPVPGCIVLCLVKMDRILEVDAGNLTLLAETGAITLDIAEAADAIGLLYPPDPGSMKISTIGGNVAENSGGLRGLKYGITRDYVMGLEVVIAAGDVIWLGSKCVKDVAGYSMKDVFIGSEGTLGIITKVLLQLVPKPAARQTLLATFARMADAAETVSAIIAAQDHPVHPGVPRQGDDPLRGGVRARRPAARRRGHPAHGNRWPSRRGRRGGEGHGSDGAEVRRRHGHARRRRPRKPRSSPPHAARPFPRSRASRRRPSWKTRPCRAASSPRWSNSSRNVGARHDLRIGTFGHMGDGNLHPTFLTDETNHAEMERVEKAMKEIFDFAISVGGTITGEHGVGLAKKAFLPGAIGERSLGLMRQLKQTLDPKGILNPGKIFD